VNGEANPRGRRSEAPSFADELAAERADARAAARRAFGVTGGGQVPRLRGALAASSGWYPLLALGLLALVDEFQSYAFFVLGPEISATLGISKTALATLVLVKSIAITIAVMPLAAFVQRRARRAFVSIATAFGWSVMTALTGFVVDVWGLLGVLSVDGLTTGSVRAVHTPLIMDSYEPGVRARALAFYRGANAMGNITAPLLVALLTTVFALTWRGVFVAMGGVCLVAAAFAVGLRDPGFGHYDVDRARAATRSASKGDAPTVAEVPDDAASLGFVEIARRLLLVPTIRRVLAFNVVLGMLLVPMSTFLFFFLEERWNMSPGARGLLFAGAAAFSFPVLWWFGRNGERMFRRDPAALVVLASWTIGAAVLALAGAVFVPLFAVMVVLVGLTLAFVAAAFPAISLIALSIVPPRMRPHVAALVGIALAAVGGVGGLVLLGGVDRRFGVGGALVALAIPGIAAAIVLLGARRTVNDDLDRMIDQLLLGEELAALAERGIPAPLLACRRIEFSYGALQVLFQLDFEVEEGQVVALLGTNGAGKSTLLRVVSGLGLPSSGAVHFRGLDVTYVDAERRVALGMALVPGGRGVFTALSVVDNLRAAAYSLGRDRRSVERGIEDALAGFPALADRRNQPASTLSGGERQMLALGKALILRPRLLLVDELSLGLAPRIVSELLETVRTINARGTAVVLVEQSVNLALSIAHRAYFLQRGRVRFEGVPADLLERDDLLRSVFLEGAASALGP